MNEVKQAQTEKSDHPGVVAFPPLIYAVPLLVGLLLHWAFSFPGIYGAFPVALGLTSLVLGAGLALGHFSMSRNQAKAVGLLYRHKQWVCFTGKKQ